MHSLRNETKSQNTKDSLEGVTCKMDTPIVSSAYNKMSDVEEKGNFNTGVIVNDITGNGFIKNATAKKDAAYENEGSSRKGVRRNVLKIIPETLPCPVETKKTTEFPQIVVDHVIPIQNEMKTFRFQEMNASYSKTYMLGVVLWSLCFVFFFT